MEIIQETSQPTRLSELASKAQEQSETASFMEPGQKVKKKPGRPKKDSKEAKGVFGKQDTAPERPQEPQIPTSTIVKPLINLMSTGAAAWADDERARMKPEELEAGAQALGMIVDKYLPDAMNKYAPEIIFAMVFGQYGLRVFALKKMKELENWDLDNKSEKNNFQKEPNIETPDSLKVQ